MMIKPLDTYQLYVFPKIGVPQNGWVIMENPIKMDDLGVPLFSETSIYCLESICIITSFKGLRFFNFHHLGTLFDISFRMSCSTTKTCKV